MSSPKTDATQVDPAVWRTAWTVLVGGLAVLFDTTIVAVALHTLASDLHASVATIQWVSTGYLLALGVTIPIAGWAQRVLGGKRLWLVALTVFLLGSVFSVLGPTPEGRSSIYGIGLSILWTLLLGVGLWGASRANVSVDRRRSG